MRHHTRRRRAHRDLHRSRPTTRKVVIAGVIVCVLIGAAIYWRYGHRSEQSRLIESLALFANLPENTWVRVAVGNDGNWTRQGHAGLAYDSKRGSLLIFGSDTHGANWDNTVHEFSPLLREWHTLGAIAGPETYAATSTGLPAAGANGMQPWAMHTYDGIEYDPKLDALIVAAATDHNPAPVSGITGQRTWIFERATAQWRPLDGDPESKVRLFGAALAYDGWRDTLVLCREGIWELGPKRTAWQQVARAERCDLHHNLVFDSDSGHFIVFGRYRASADLWEYSPGLTAGLKGEWKQLGAVDCPLMSGLPVAYDRNAHKFVLVAKLNRAGSKDEYGTFTYDPRAGRCTQITGANIDPGHMNFMMVWHANLRVSLLVTGDWRQPTEVWALRLAKR